MVHVILHVQILLQNNKDWSVTVIDLEKINKKITFLQFISVKKQI